jgi:hypothetical protein
MSHGERAPAGPTPEPGPWPPLLSCAQGRAGASLQEAIDCSSCEFARVLKPGGRLIILDSLQRGDEPDYDGLLEMFPQNFHEPYYAGYLDEDFGHIAQEAGLRHIRSENVFVSKAMIFDKP